MAGRTYGIREMKAIVDYLTENKLYGEIKGRKMWMDYANSKLTNRTWQSLKETFLKRILPDIHNPYYKLTIEQINSFRAGHDIDDRNKSKLEIHTVSDDSNGPEPSDTVQKSNGNDEMQENDAGEIVQSSKIPLRSRSADTVILDTCYETAEDIKKDLESPKHNNETIENKSLRDCITYLEPLTPMLQEVLDDFQSEPENGSELLNKENPSQVVNEVNIENIENISNEVSKIVKDNQSSKSDHISTDAPTMDSDPVAIVEKESDLKHPEVIQANEIHSEREKMGNPEITNDTETEVLFLDNSENQIENVKLNNIEEPTKNQIAKSSEKSIDQAHVTNTVAVSFSGALNTSENTPDASLPNNPEALNKKASIDSQVEETVSVANNPDSKISRKRLNSQSTTKVIDNKKTKLEVRKMKATSETESKTATKTIIKTKAKSVEPRANQNETQIIKQKNHANDTNSSKLEDIIEIPTITISDDIEKAPQVSDKIQNNLVNKSSDPKNPCLQNLSLYDEQLNKLQYNSSESSDIAHTTKKNERNKSKEISAEQNEIVMLRSHTDTDTDTEEQNKSTKVKHARRASAKLERDRGLAKVFGFASGAGPSKRKRRLSHRRRTISQNNIRDNNARSASSEWTSESDSEMYVSPPRGRKNRQTRKYLKPQYARIQSLEEEGGLFVMYGKKIYPLVKDGKLVKHYLTYLPESESEEENYWKSKYVEEKKKAAELKKLLQEAKSPRTMKPASPSPQPSRLRTPVFNHDQPQQSSKNDGKEICLSSHDEKNVEGQNIPPESIKIKFTTKNDQEIHLEGNWPQLQNALEHVVHIFHKPQPIIGDNKLQAIIQAPSSSGIASPVIISSVEASVADPEIHEKVNKIEDKIFEEIEEKDKEELQQPAEKDNINVTKRKPGRPPNLSRSISESPSKRLKISNQQLPNEAQENNINKANNTEIQNSEVSSKKQLRTPQKDHKAESLNTNETKTIQTRRSRSKLNTSNVAETNDDEEIFYMLPPKNKKQNIKATDIKTREKFKKSLINTCKRVPSIETACPNSMESTQGYQDSDPTPMKNDPRRKKRLNTSLVKYKNLNHLRRSARNRPKPFRYYDDSSSSSIGVPVKLVQQDNSTFNTDAYKSESYQLLIPALKKTSVSQQLDPIEEMHLDVNEIDTNRESNETYSLHINAVHINQSSPQCSSDIGSSSNMSLPLSPELSVVESLSVSKELLNVLKDEPTINEMQGNETNVVTTCSQFLMSGIDISIPLMQQASTLESCHPKDPVTESLLNQVETINIEDHVRGVNLTDTLDVKLRDLLLESAKKIAQQNVKDNTENMDVDETNIEISKEAKHKKRCSTPRKRNKSLKSKKSLKVQELIEEEQVENYALIGRKSCPPIMQPLPIEASIDEEEINFANLTIDKNIKSTNRKKKDIIKVKIIRPKRKKSQNATANNNNYITSTCNDSGINHTESEVFLAIDESVDLIHNHSETCLHANECVGDSVEFVENSMKSALVLSDSSQSEDMWCSQGEINDAENVSPDFYGNKFQNAKNYDTKQENILNTSETVYHSPLGTETSSIMTEDLSDDLPLPPDRPDKWYLLSEDESTNVNITKAEDRRATICSFGSNLKQIFTLTCAVPDLSTITEISRENDANQKSLLESLNGDGFSSQGIFDSNL